MQLAGSTYEALYRSWQWNVPARFNIAAAVCGVHAAARPETTALIEVAEAGASRRWTFGEIEEQASRLANALSALGVTRGSFVAVHLSQSIECLTAHLAVLKLGGVVMPLFGLFGPDAMTFRLEDSAARVLISTASSVERLAADLARLPDLKHVITVGGAPNGAHDFHALLAAANSSAPTLDTSAEDPAYLMYTSGTTGNPKGVLHAHRVLIGHLPGVMVPHDLFPKPGDRFWTPADWAWAGGIFDVLLPSLYCGVPVVAQRMAKFDPEAAFALMARHEIRNVFMPPTALRLMRQVPNPASRHAYKLRSLATGGEPLGADMIAWGQETFGLTFAEFYGQTECNLVVGNCPSVFPPRPGSMGRPIPGHTVAIVDRQGNVLPKGETGIVAVKRPDPVMFLEYWRQPQATADKLRGDWCLLGDIATEDGDGYFWFQGRDNDIIKSSGYRIGPGEVEECIAKHPAVALVGVIGTPDPVRGEVVTAFIVPAGGHVPGPELAADIQAFVRERLAAHEYPRKIRFLTEMPMTVTGKVRRVDLRALDREMG
jgi:acetyl-CoA synthetase